MDLQACSPPALAIHNFIRDINPIDVNNFTEAEDMQPGWCSGDLADALPHCPERERANNRHDDIANAMWDQYQQHLAAGGDGDDDGDNNDYDYI